MTYLGTVSINGHPNTNQSADILSYDRSFTSQPGNTDLEALVSDAQEFFGSVSTQTIQNMNVSLRSIN